MYKQYFNTCLHWISSNDWQHYEMHFDSDVWTVLFDAHCLGITFNDQTFSFDQFIWQSVTFRHLSCFYISITVTNVFIVNSSTGLFLTAQCVKSTKTQKEPTWKSYHSYTSLTSEEYSNSQWQLRVENKSAITLADPKVLIKNNQILITRPREYIIYTQS